MRLLLDTHILIWAMDAPDKLSREAVSLISDEDNELFFSLASIWEVAIKYGLGRTGFEIEPREFRQILLDNDYSELQISPRHVIAVAGLAYHHKDPFDRLLVAQSEIESCLFLTVDKTVSLYGNNVRKV